jgi:hypothetical protein
MNAANGISLTAPAEALEPLIEQVVAAALTRFEEARETLPDDRLCYTESEAARLLSLKPHVLRDERLRGCISASSIVGRRVRYTRGDLMAYLMQRRKVAAK